MLKRKIFFVVRLCISVGLIAFIFAKTDLGALLTAIRELDVGLFGLGLGCTVVAVLLRSYKWQLLLQAQQAKVSFRSSVSLSCMALFVNNFFLGTLGGDAYRVYLARGFSKTTGSATSSVLMERATGFLAALLLVVAIGVLLVLDSGGIVSTRMLVVISLVGAALGAVFIGGLLVSSKLASTRLLGGIPVLQKFVRDLTASVWEYKAYPGVMISSMVLSLLFHVIQAIAVYCFVLAASAEARIVPLLFITPLVGIVVVLPISINGIGVREGIYVFYLQLLGLTNPVAVLVALSGRVANMLISLYGGLLILLRMWGRQKEPAVAEEACRS